MMVLLIGSRLDKVDLMEDKKFPIILHRNRRLTKMILDDYHGEVRQKK